MHKRLAIIIPVYKDVIDKFEQASLQKCCLTLDKYEIFLVTHDAVILKEYLEICPKAKVKYFNKKYFNNIEGYNKLMLNLNFYKAFLNFEYIMIYQLDALILKNDIEEWLDKEYDYIGAPWKSITSSGICDNLTQSGNGGLSLRKVKSFVSVLRTFNTIYTFSYLLNRAISTKKPIQVLKAVLYFLFSNNFYYRLNNFDKNEDLFWGIIVPRKVKTFKIPNPKVAANFSIDTDVQYWLSMIQPKLPTGIHAFNKNIRIWDKHIEI